MISLNLSDNYIITDDGISRMVHLSDLRLDFNREITNDCIKQLPSITKLSCITNDFINDDGLVGLVNMKSLRIRTSRYVPVTMDCTKHMTSLTDLTIMGKEIVNLDFLYNHQINNLRRLIVMSSHVELGNMDNLVSSISNITELKLSSNKIITDQVVIMLQQLTILHIPHNTKLTYESVSSLVNLVFIPSAIRR